MRSGARPNTRRCTRRRRNETRERPGSGLRSVAVRPTDEHLPCSEELDHIVFGVDVCRVGFGCHSGIDFSLRVDVGAVGLWRHCGGDCCVALGFGVVAVVVGVADGVADDVEQDVGATGVWTRFRPRSGSFRPSGRPLPRSVRWNPGSEVHRRWWWVRQWRPAGRSDRNPSCVGVTTVTFTSTPTASSGTTVLSAPDATATEPVTWRSRGVGIREAARPGPRFGPRVEDAFGGRSITVTGRSPLSMAAWVMLSPPAPSVTATAAPMALHRVRRNPWRVRCSLMVIPHFGFAGRLARSRRTVGHPAEAPSSALSGQPLRLEDAACGTVGSVASRALVHRWLARWPGDGLGIDRPGAAIVRRVGSRLGRSDYVAMIRQTAPLSA